MENGKYSTFYEVNVSINVDGTLPHAWKAVVRSLKYGDSETFFSNSVNAVMKKVGKWIDTK